MTIAADTVTKPGGMSVRRLSSAYRSGTRRRVLVVLGALVFAIAMLTFDVTSGPSNMSLATFIKTLLLPDDAETGLRVIVWNLRLPIALMALLIGAMLGIAGAQMQTILHNPLADPFTLGISSAASFGAALAIVAQWSLIPGYGGLIVSGNAFVMALLTSAILYAFTRLRGVTSETMILVGIAMLFTFNALVALMQYGANEIQLAQIVFWMLGSLARASWEKVAVCTAMLAIVLPWFMSRNWALTALRMGDDKAASLGVDVKRLRIEMLVGISLLAATAVSFVGVIAFVGLVGPHIARLLVGEDQRFFLPVSALASALILSATSLLAKSITPGVVYPIGMITSLIGVPFFIALILSVRRRSWQ
ncbi:MAG: iron ABC transporter permease [Pseudomonadota bacterium]